MKILLYSSSKKVKRKIFTGYRINQLRKALGMNVSYETKMFNIRTEMKYITLKNK